MKEKALGLLLAVGLFTAAGTVVSSALTNPTAFLADDSCSHVGYEYDGLPLTKEEYGVKPYFVCCKCHQHFINEGSAPAGSWTKSTLTLDEYKEVISYKDDRLIKSPYKALESESEFYNYFHFAAWGSHNIPGTQMQIVSNNLNVVSDAILSESQLLGANYLRLKMNVESSDSRTPKRLLAFHGGGAADKESIANIDTNGDVVVTVNLKSYLYDVDGSFKLGINFYVADDLVYYENPGAFTSSANFIPNCTWTITEVTPLTDYNVVKGISNNFEVTYDSEGIVTEFSFEDIDVSTSVDWNVSMFKLSTSYWAGLYAKGYRQVVVSPSFLVNDGTGGIYDFTRGNQYFPGNGATQGFELTEAGLDIGFGKVNHGNGRHYNDKITYKVVLLAKNAEEYKLKTMLSSQDNLWRYFNFASWGACNPGVGSGASMSFVAGNALLTSNLFTDLYAAGFTHFEFDLELDLVDKSTYENVNRWVYTTNNASWDLVYAEGNYDGKTHLDIDFSKAFSQGLSGSESIYLRGRVQNSETLIEAPNCTFTISNISFR